MSCYLVDTTRGQVSVETARHPFPHGPFVRVAAVDGLMLEFGSERNAAGGWDSVVHDPRTGETRRRCNVLSHDRGLTERQMVAEWNRQPRLVLVPTAIAHSAGEREQRKLRHAVRIRTRPSRARVGRLVGVGWALTDVTPLDSLPPAVRGRSIKQLAPRGSQPQPGPRQHGGGTVRQGRLLPTPLAARTT